MQVTVVAKYTDAPNSVDRDNRYDFGPVFRSPDFTQYYPAMDLIGKGFVSEIGVISAVPTLGSLPAISVKGPVLGAALELGGRLITQATEVDEWAEAVQTSLEEAGAEFRALEEAAPEVTGPELPW